MTQADEGTQDPERPTPSAEDVAAPALTDASTTEPTTTPDGSLRSRFLLEFPEDPELTRLVDAFERGNYEAVRTGAPKLVAATDNEAVRAAARELRRRIDPDPLMKYLLWVALALFVFVVWYTYQNH